MIQMDLFTNQKQTQRSRKKIYGYQRGWVGEGTKEVGINIYIIGKESTCSAGAVGSITGLRRSPGGRHGYPLQYSCLENPRDRSLEGYSSRGRKELDMTEMTWHARIYKTDNQ